MDRKEIKNTMRFYIEGCEKKTHGFKNLRQIIHELEIEAAEMEADNIYVG